MSNEEEEGDPDDLNEDEEKEDEVNMFFDVLVDDEAQRNL